MYLKNFFSDYTLLFTNPTQLLNKDYSIQKQIWYLFHALWFSLIVGTLFSAVTYYVSLLAGYDTNSNSLVYNFINESNLGNVLFVTAFVAPLTEESGFRLMQSTSKFFFSTGLVLFLLFTYFLVGNSPIFIFAAIIIAPLIPLTISLDNEKITKLLKNNISIIIWTSCVLFASVHLVNFKDVQDYWYLAPFLVLTQFFSGTVYSFIRITFGIDKSVLLHALFNASIVLFVFLFGPLFIFK